MSNDRTIPQGTFATVPTVDRMLPDGTYITGTSAAAPSFNAAWAYIKSAIIGAGVR